MSEVANFDEIIFAENDVLGPESHVNDLVCLDFFENLQQLFAYHLNL
jgi:hypothetical protein